jgi:putative nucleotidyltransferase with HDIG domain
LPFLFPLTASHPALEPWRDAALRHGYTVVAVMPLMIRGQLLGSLVVPGFGIAGFADDDVALLGEVAGLLSYGIAALRDRAAHESGLLKRREVIEATVTALANTLEESDPYTAGHQRRTADLAVAIARQMGLAEQTVYGIRLASLIHDVGKIAAPAEILNRPGKLSSAQFEIIKTHCKVGFDIVKGIDFSWPVAQTILQHHERLDGSGYPAGLAGGQILLEARIVAVADVVEAITSFRPYRPALGIDVALDEIGSGRGRHYDPAVVDACLAAVHGGALGFA